MMWEKVVCDLTLISWIWVAVDMSCGFGRQKHVEPEVGCIALFHS